MQIKTILKFHVIYGRMAKISNTNEGLCWQDWGTMRTHFHCYNGNQYVSSLGNWEFIYLKTQLYNFWVYIQKTSTISQEHQLNHVHCDFIHSSKKCGKKSHKSLSRKIDKENVLHFHLKYYSTVRNDIIKYAGKWI